MMKKLICIFLCIAILFTGCQTTPVDNPIVESPTPSAVTETPGGTVTETPDEDETQTPTADSTSEQTETATPTPTATTDVTWTSTPTSTATSTTASTTTSTTTSTSTASTTKKPTATPTQAAKPTPTPTATPKPVIKTFSIPISVAGSVRTDAKKVNFKGYYKNNDAKSGTIIVAQNTSLKFTLVSSGTNWEFSSAYSKYPTNVMSVKQSSEELTEAIVTVDFKEGTEISVDDMEFAQFVYVPKYTVDNGIPTMLINVASSTDYYNLITSTDKSVKDIWSEASYAIVEGKTKTYNMKDAQGTLKIKRRGFTSFDFDKKSYTVKLTDGKALLGMESNKDWVLAANYSDKSMLRNYFAYQIGQQMKNQWVSDCDFLDVYITNGITSNYLGTYLLVEKIEVSDEKIDIQEMTEKDTNIGAVSYTKGASQSQINQILAGSFLVELETFDRASSGDMLISSYNAGDGDDGGKYQLSVKSPDKDLFAPDGRTTGVRTHNATKNKNLAEYIRTFFITVDDAIDTNDYNEFSKYIDVDSFVDYYIINELAKNVDGNFRLSTYFYKDKGGKLKVTIWDFDIAFGNCDYMRDSNGNDGAATSGYYIRTETSWYRHLFQSSEFRNKVKARWDALRKGVLSDSNIASMLNKQAKVLDKAADANFERWDILGTQVWPNPWQIVACDTYEENVAWLISWLQGRAAWLDDNIGRASV